MCIFLILKQTEKMCMLTLLPLQILNLTSGQSIIELNTKKKNDMPEIDGNISTYIMSEPWTIEKLSISTLEDFMWRFGTLSNSQ